MKSSSEITIRFNSIAEMSAFSSAIQKGTNFEPLMLQLGAAMTKSSQRAFREGGTPEKKWSPQYGGQPEPFIHFAGALRDLSSGGRIKDRRFRRGVPLSDTGDLKRSLSPDKSVKTKGPFRVEVGTTIPYARQMQSGGESRQPITANAVKNLDEEIKREKGRTKKGKWEKRGTDRLIALYKLRKKLKSSGSMLVTKIHARPFLFVDDEFRKKSVKMVGQFIGRLAK